jgi:hypothetical protein
MPAFFCHTSASLGGIIAGLRYGFTMVVACAGFDVKKILEAIIEVG